MFAKAMELVAQFTRPVILSKRLEDKTVQSGMATFVVVNKDGWILTAAHVVNDVLLAEQHGKERAEYQTKLNAINADTTTTPGKKRFLAGQLTAKSSWITNNSAWWGQDGIGFDVIHFNHEADLAVAKLNGQINKLDIKTYPRFADPAKPLVQGTSLCRLGFPFHEVKTTFSTTTGLFELIDLPPLCMFPNDGIMTRNIAFADAVGAKTIHFIETSTPGLRGQSGGPIFDVNGTVWALQSRTSSLALGFSPKVVINRKEIVEHQFMHVGWGTHVSHIRELFAHHKIDFQSA
jgi:S1-C subfamily serine protease